MTVKQITEAIEEFAPLALQESYDNSGLIVGQSDRHVRSALVCVDITEPVIREAIETGAEMIISHHPAIFHAIKRLNSASYIERVVETAVKHDIALYACHTNLDSAGGGMSFRLADILGIRNPAVLAPRTDKCSGFGIVGDIQPTGAVEFLSHVKRSLGIKAIRYSDTVFETINRVALCTGAGASLADDAREAGAQLYIAADFKYNDFLDADRDLIIADIGHFESEYCAIELIIDIIRKKFPNFALHKSKCSRNPINYLV